MFKLRTLGLYPEFLSRNRTYICLLLLTVFLAASPASAVEFDVQGTKVTLGGYIKLMAIYDDALVETGPYKGDLLAAYDVPLDGTANADEDEFRMTARESRIFMKTKSETDEGVINTHFEGDFFGGSDNASHTWSGNDAFRIRHAYGSLTRGSHEILAGQTWSTFMDLAAGVPAMDLAGDPGFSFVRQPQIRYQYNLRPGHYMAVAIENPDRGLTAAGPVSFYTNSGQSSDSMPDFVLKYFYANKRLTLSPRFIVRQFDLTDTATGESATGTGWGGALSSSVKAGPVKFYATVMYGDGLGRYGGLGNMGDAGLTAANDVETTKFTSVNGGLTIELTPAVKWTVGAGWAENDDDAYVGADAILTANATKTAIGYHTNLKWAVSPKVEWAIGVEKFDREVMDGREGDMFRYQMYFKYDF